MVFSSSPPSSPPPPPSPHEAPPPHYLNDVLDDMSDTSDSDSDSDFDPLPRRPRPDLARLNSGDSTASSQHSNLSNAQPRTGRKRDYARYQPHLSSDPVFSEDISESEGLGDMRKKRVYRGPWWSNTTQGDAAGSSHRAKPADSGVWLGSDLSDNAGAVRSQSSRTSKTFNAPIRTKQQVRATPRKPKAAESEVCPRQKQAAELIWQCVEQSKERIDISGMSLGKIKESTLAPLQQLVLSRNPDESGCFGPLTPSIQIFLANNGLKELPKELCRLKDITVLSVRNNNLQELPRNINNLTRLRELNIASNQIRWLPFSFLELLARNVDHRNDLYIQARPNPLLEPCEPHEYPEGRLMIRRAASAAAVSKSWETQAMDPTLVFPNMVHRVLARHLDLLENGLPTSHIPIFGASSEIHYFHPDGTALRDRIDASGRLRAWNSRAVLQPGRSNPDRSSAAPSLYESVLRTLAHSKAWLSSEDRTDDVPSKVKDLFDNIGTPSTENWDRCSVCKSAYKIKRAEWIEYWNCTGRGVDFSPEEMFLPFLREACSWACADRAITERLHF